MSEPKGVRQQQPQENARGVHVGQPTQAGPGNWRFCLETPGPEISAVSESAGDLTAPTVRYHSLIALGPKAIWRTLWLASVLLVGRPAIAQKCIACHPDASGPQFKKSVHASNACTDCHAVHAVPHPPVRPPAGGLADGRAAAVRRRRVLAACGRCHARAAERYSRSIHAAAEAKGIEDAPDCTDCHGKHGIRSHLDPLSPPFGGVANTCSRCHEAPAILRRWNLPPERLISYRDSLHGIAAEAGDASAPNCATCHNSHYILPSSDPRSSVNKKNLPRTCGKCHQGASINFARGDVHVRPARSRDIGVFVVQTFYRYFITILVSAFLIYIALDLVAHWRGRRSRRGQGSGA